MGSEKRGWKEKQAKAAKVPSPLKRPRSAQPSEFMKRTIELRFQYLDDGMNWRKCGGACDCDALKLLGILKSFEFRAWSNVYQNLKRDHPIPPSQLEKRAQERLSALGHEDVDELWCFHFDQIGRLWGYRFEHELRMLWLDPDHQVYVVDIQDR